MAINTSKDEGFIPFSENVVANAISDSFQGAPFNHFSFQAFSLQALLAAGQVLTSTGVNVTDGDTVTIGTKTYTFKTNLTPTEGEVHIGGTAALSLAHLAAAINHTGMSGTDYDCVVNTQVTAVATATTVTITAITAGSAGNAIATTAVATTLSWGAATMAGGQDLSTASVSVQASLESTQDPQHWVELFAVAVGELKQIIGVFGWLRFVRDDTANSVSVVARRGCYTS